MPGFHELIYNSLAVRAMSSNDLLALLEQSRDKNKRLGITGFLVYHHGEFIQILEGGKKEVLDLYDTITQDERHTEVNLIWEGPIAERGFSDWSMAFANTNLLDLSRLEGYSEYLQKRFSLSLGIPGVETITKQLLKSMFALSLAQESIYHERKKTKGLIQIPGCWM